MDLLGTPERKRFWEGLAEQHLENQQKARRERDRLRRMLAAIDRDAAQAKAPELKAYLALTRRLNEVFLAQIEALQPENMVWGYPDGAVLARAEWCLLESQWLMLQQDAMDLARLAAVLDEDLEKARAGEPARAGLPRAWMALRAKASGPWYDVLTAFQADFPAFHEAVEAARPLMEAIAELPLPERLAEAKALNVPAIRGMHYRLEAHFRRMPEGEGFLKGMRWYVAKQPPEAPPPTVRRRGITDRMLEFLKPKP